jgi:hypothetical protein
MHRSIIVVKQKSINESTMGNISHTCIIESGVELNENICEHNFLYSEK